MIQPSGEGPKKELAARLYENSRGFTLAMVDACISFGSAEDFEKKALARFGKKKYLVPS